MVTYRLRLAVLVALAAAALPTFAQAFPTKPLRFIVPFAAGGPADVVAREVGQALGSALGQTAIVENQGGGAGVTALTTVARSEPDGHTLLFAASGNIVLQPQVSKKSGGADLLSKLRPVGLVSTGPHVLVVSGKTQITSVKELIDYAKANPGKLNYGSAGVGGAAHLGMEYFMSAAKIDMTHVPYKGTSAAVGDLIAGSIEVMFSSPPSLQAAIDKGYIRALGMSAAGGTGAAKSLPVIGSVVPGFEFTTWYGVFAPVGTPQPVVDKLNATLRNVLGNAAIKAKMAEQGVELVSSTPQELSQIMKRDTDKWAKVIRDAKITID